MIDGRKGALAYLDSNVFIDFVEGQPELAQPARRILSALTQHDGIFVTSELSLAEVLAATKISPLTPVSRDMALRQNCRFMISRDRDMKKLPVGMITHLNTDAATVEALQEAANGR